MSTVGPNGLTVVIRPGLPERSKRCLLQILLNDSPGSEDNDDVLSAIRNYMPESAGVARCGGCRSVAKKISTRTLAPSEQREDAEQDDVLAGYEAVAEAASEQTRLNVNELSDLGQHLNRLTLAKMPCLWIDINKTSNHRTRLLVPPLTRLPPRVVNNYTFNSDGHANDILLSDKKPRRRKRPNKAKKKEGKEKRRKTCGGNQQGVKDANISLN
ncbi:uncharacterized protein P174DRAFT_432279 [Aspergillus novofumigatus IBT 16806]|uniref:Uncharacterized protein n=1 Tax=Aspergillus novofumigatus (strain IBT 16806) TaxID=1392255 RepID=A0A2I1C5I5_ASPN1|nr:uncharacterized protein P174DRAFT_432279 [Aspergillus novofumigatus IBT 16806]PKX92919.1 hypothetical protein P174DRAFT_432279 [Aspergillus novofumigatus IBT 16806]